MQRAFISYAHEDATFVDRLARALRHDFNVWVDRHKMQSGASLLDQVAAAIDAAAYVLPILSKSSVRSKWVRQEIAIADMRGAKVVPIRLDKARVPTAVVHLPYVDFVDEQFPDAVARLIHLTDRDVLVSDQLKLVRFTVWGSVLTKFIDQFTVSLTSRGKNFVTTGLLLDEPFVFSHKSFFMLSVANTSAADFTGWSSVFPKLLKVCVDGQPILPRNRADRVDDEPSYIPPRDGRYLFKLPREVIEAGAIRKIEIVLGSGKFKALTLSASLA